MHSRLSSLWNISTELSGPQRREAGSPGKHQPGEQHPGRRSCELLCPPCWHQCGCQPTAAHVRRACGGGPAAYSCSCTSQFPRPPAAQPCQARSSQPVVSQPRYGRPESERTETRRVKSGGCWSDVMRKVSPGMAASST